MEMMATPLTSSGWWSTTRKCPLVQNKFSQKSCLLLQLQPSTTPTESFTRFRSGLVWVPVWNSCLRNGGFSFSGDSYFLFTVTFLQPLRSCWMSSDVVAQLTVPHIGVVAGRSASAAQLHADSAAAQTASMLPMDEEEEEPNMWGRTACRTDSDLYWLVWCTSDSVICFVMMCFVIRYPVTPGKMIAKTFLLNISSAFHQNGFKLTIFVIQLKTFNLICNMIGFSFVSKKLWISSAFIFLKYRKSLKKTSRYNFSPGLLIFFPWLVLCIII